MHRRNLLVDKAVKDNKTREPVGDVRRTLKYEVVAEKVTQFLLATGIDQSVRCKS